MAPDLGLASSSSRVHGFAKKVAGQHELSLRLLKMLLRGKDLRVGVPSVFAQASRGSEAGEGSCVQSSFSFHLIGLVFLDLGSRHRSTSDKLLLAAWMVSVIYWAMQDGSCNKTYLHSLPGHVGGHIRRQGTDKGRL